MVLLAFWCSLRRGELRGLQRRGLDLLHGWVDVRDQVVDVGGTILTGQPKTKAGRRSIAIPPPVREDVAGHLDAWVDGEATSNVFTGANGGGPLPSATWRRAWSEARQATGLTSERDQAIMAALAAYVPPGDVVVLTSPDIRRMTAG